MRSHTTHNHSFSMRREKQFQFPFKLHHFLRVSTFPLDLSPSLTSLAYKLQKEEEEENRCIICERTEDGARAYRLETNAKNTHPTLIWHLHNNNTKRTPCVVFHSLLNWKSMMGERATEEPKTKKKKPKSVQLDAGEFVIVNVLLHAFAIRRAFHRLKWSCNVYAAVLSRPSNGSHPSKSNQSNAYKKAKRTKKKEAKEKKSQTTTCSCRICSRPSHHVHATQNNAYTDAART